MENLPLIDPWTDIVPHWLPAILHLALDRPRIDTDFASLRFPATEKSPAGVRALSAYTQSAYTFALARPGWCRDPRRRRRDIPRALCRGHASGHRPVRR